MSEPQLLTMGGISKSFPGVQALQGVDLELQAGEVLALLGENGAGKSTLIKILAGAESPDDGTIEIQGRPVTFTGPLDAQRAGVGVIYQEFNLVPAMSARENIFLGQEPSRLSWIRHRQEHQRAAELFQRIGVSVPPETWCRDLTVAQQQVVEIAKALALNARILVMDEPSAALSPREVAGLFQIVRELRAQGMGVIYISHRLDEIFEVADRVMVLRDGRHVGTRPIDQLDRATMIEMMVGRTLEDEFPKRHPATTLARDANTADAVAQHDARNDAPVTASETGLPVVDGLSVRGLARRGTVDNVSFDVRRGEIVALTGLVGAGRTEVARLIFGADRRDGGNLFLDGNPLVIRTPRDAIAQGVCLLTEDRKSQGLVLGLSALENFGLPNMGRFAPRIWLRRATERVAFQGYVDQLRVKLASPQQRVGTLSGGNQQKIVMAKWLQRQAEVIMFDEPTRGIDVGAKYEIYVLMNELAAAGKAVLMISSEMPEVLGMADRILVMHAGRITGEIHDARQATQAQVMEYAVQ